MTDFKRSVKKSYSQALTIVILEKFTMWKKSAFLLPKLLSLFHENSSMIRPWHFAEQRKYIGRPLPWVFTSPGQSEDNDAWVIKLCMYQILSVHNLYGFSFKTCLFNRHFGWIGFWNSFLFHNLSVTKHNDGSLGKHERRKKEIDRKYFQNLLHWSTKLLEPNLAILKSTRHSLWGLIRRNAVNLWEDNKEKTLYCQSSKVVWHSYWLMSIKREFKCISKLIIVREFC